MADVVQLPPDNESQSPDGEPNIPVPVVEPKAIVTKPSKLPNFLSGFFLISLLVTFIIAGLALGMIADKKFIAGKFSPFGSTALKTDAIVYPTDKDQLAGIAKLISEAQSEVLVMANTLTSKTIIQALANQTASGKKVFIILDPINNRDLQAGSVVNYLVTHNVGQVFIDTIPNFNQLIIIDQRYIILGNAPFSTKAEQNDAASLIVLDDKKLAGILRTYYESRGKASKKVNQSPPQ